GTRSEIKAYIKKGFVKMNDTIVKKPDIKVDSPLDNISYRGEYILLPDFEYYLLNKPAGYVSATKDNTAPTVLSLIDSKRRDLFPVGRLDKDTEGLLLITNDGELSHILLSPKHHVDKTYYAVVEGTVTKKDIESFKNGLEIGDDDLGTAMPAILSVLSIDAVKNLSYVEVTIQEGKYHQVKRMFRAVNKQVVYLRRIAFGSLSLPDTLPLGKYRPLTDEELEQLYKAGR
ncbi:MAG: 16S rRNA pseudouridine(516) synthase, partial [Lachnospiraceae bacterium]|nr:16S rRNA pseudouridine(516) synthase [Lachnospiraceae bacterium]